MKKAVVALISVLLISILSVSGVSAYQMPEGMLVTLTEGESFENIQSLQVYGYVGDTDLNGKVNIKDATAIQKFLASIIEIDEDAKRLADADLSGKINVKDATAIQKFLAGISSEAPVYHALFATDDEARFQFMLGSWAAKINISKELNNAFADSNNGLGFDFKDIEVGVLLTLNEDMSYSLEYDDRTFAETLNQLRKEYSEGMIKYFEQFIKDNKLNTTVDKILETSGYKSVEEFVNAAVSEEKLKALMDIDTVKGKFKVDKNTVFITNSNITDDEYVGYFDFGFYDTNLMIENGNLFENHDFYPIIFERQ